MARRAAICIGVNQAGTMLPLQAAVKGAQDFGAWAVGQGCDTKVLVDSATTRIGLIDVFDAVQERASTNAYDQLIIYFSGHGILNAPTVEFWLLSRAPENANEAVNLYRSIEDARNCGIPHVVFISDACRSSVTGPPLSGVSGGTIFPNRGYNQNRGEIDVFYATRPGDPAWELPQAQAAGNYRGVFTEILLGTVTLPEEELVDRITSTPAPLNVIPSRKLKPVLESIVPTHAASLDVRIRQTPEIQVGTALPKYFATIDDASIQRRSLGVPLAPSSPVPSMESALGAMRGIALPSSMEPRARDVSLAAQLGLTAEVQRLQDARGRGHFETQTGFTLHGAQPVAAEAPGWRIDPAFPEGPAWHWRFEPAGNTASSAVLRYQTPDGVRGTVVAVVPQFIGSVVVDESGRVVSINYVPSDNSWRYAKYQRRAKEIEKMKAVAAVAAREGRFEVPVEKASAFAERIRRDKGLDPILGLYAAYAYAQAGRYEDVLSVFDYMRRDVLPIPFDVVMLAGRLNAKAALAARYAPFVPMLTQGWALIAAGDPMFRPIHQTLRPHLIPSLWTTLTAQGADLAARHLNTEAGN